MELDSAVAETNNEIAQAYNRRGSIRVRALEVEEAINDFTRVIAFDPDNAEKTSYCRVGSVQTLLASQTTMRCNERDHLFVTSGDTP